MDGGNRYGSQDGGRVAEVATSQVEIREMRSGDEDQVVELLQLTLGWAPDPRYPAFYRWKHLQNPFGPSPAWVACAGATVVAFRTFLRWDFDWGGRTVKAVRAVDTVTHPDWQRRGLFRRLTSTALETLAAEGDVGFIFNTPNPKSAAGYRELGWEEVRRMPVAVRPASARKLPVIVRTRGRSERWPLPCHAGVPAAEVLGQPAALSQLLAARRTATGMATNRTPEFLAWRYGSELLGYRALPAAADLSQGVAFFRLRRREGATEAVLCDVLTADESGRVRRSLGRRILRESGADYLVLAGQHPLRGRAVPVGSASPLLMWRRLPGLADVRELPAWDFSFGDLELF